MPLKLMDASLSFSLAICDAAFIPAITLSVSPVLTRESPLPEFLQQEIYSRTSFRQRSVSFFNSDSQNLKTFQPPFSSSEFISLSLFMFLSIFGYQ